MGVRSFDRAESLRQQTCALADDGHGPFPFRLPLYSPLCLFRSSADHEQSPTDDDAALMLFSSNLTPD